MSCSISFNDILNIVENKSFDVLYRTPHMTELYNDLLYSIRLRYYSIEEYIFYEILKGKFYPVLMQNQYPYNIDKNVSQYVLFDPIDYFEDNSIDDYINRARKIPKQSIEKDYVWFMNPYNQRSIKGIRHYHIFTKDMFLHELQGDVKNYV